MSKFTRLYLIVCSKYIFILVLLLCKKPCPPNTEFAIFFTYRANEKYFQHYFGSDFRGAVVAGNLIIISL